jgi:hypothetical protein
MARTYGHRDDMPPEPKSWKEMLNHPFRDQFKAAAHHEIRTLISKHTWDEVYLPKGAKPIPTKWVFTYKPDPDGMITKFRSRLVARGDLQQDVHKRDVSAITGAFKTFRLLMALTAAFDLEIIQIDAINAFVNAPIDEDIYIPIPQAYMHMEGNQGKALKLRKALYGLRKSPKLWFNHFSTTLRELGLIPVPDEPCLFVHPTELRMVFFYVDDILIFGKPGSTPELEALARKIEKTYDIRRIKEVNNFLNVRIIRDRPNRRLYLCLDQYIEKIVTKFHLEYAKLPFTPLSGQELFPYEGEATLGEINEYQTRVGSVTYPATTLRPDIAFAAGKLAGFMQNPSQTHLTEVLRVIAYLYATQYLAIEYSGTTPQEINPSQVLEIAADASFADDASTRRSSQGYLVKLFNGPILWQSSKQKTVSTSTTEAELLSLSHVGKEVQHMGRIFKAIRFNPEQEFQIECDNQQTVRIVDNKQPTISTKLRHVDIHQFWLRQEVQNGKFKVLWVPSSEMPADGLTKPLTKQLHQAFIDALGLKDIRHLIEA